MQIIQFKTMFFIVDPLAGLILFIPCNIMMHCVTAPPPHPTTLSLKQFLSQFFPLIGFGWHQLTHQSVDE